MWTGDGGGKDREARREKTRLRGREKENKLEVQEVVKRHRDTSERWKGERGKDESERGERGGEGRRAVNYRAKEKKSEGMAGR